MIPFNPNIPHTFKTNGKPREYPYKNDNTKCGVCKATSQKPACTLPVGIRCQWTILDDELED